VLSPGGRRQVTKRVLERGILSALVLTAALYSSTHPAGAERYLFDMLFKNRTPDRTATQPMREDRQERRNAATPGANVAPKQPVSKPAAQISAPSFYTFKPDPLIKVDFSRLSEALSDKRGNADPRFLAALNGLSDFDLLTEKSIAEALVQHYSNSPRFIWVDDTGPTQRADEVLDVLGNADTFGLSHLDYAVHAPIALNSQAADSSLRNGALIRFEMMLSARALRYARDAKLGRLDPNKLSGYHDFTRKRFDEKLVLQVLAAAGKPATYLESLHPKNEAFAALRTELDTLRMEGREEQEQVAIAPDILVRPGASHPDFSKILHAIDNNADEEFRAKHGAVLAAHLGSETYAEDLVPVIKTVQKQHNLNPDGVVGSRTVRALTGEPKANRIRKISLAMERLRWLPSYFESTRVMINVPSFTASYIADGTEKLSMRTVVGKPASQTYFFRDEIEYVEFNPYWGVPRSIIVNEMLPKLRRDPGYLDRAGYEVIDQRGRRIASSSINWAAYGSNVPFGVRQPPGPRNALGQLKIMFPNAHDIYMHDTPEKSLFSRDSRAFSHGCVRLEDPRAMAAAVLGISEEEVAANIERGRNARRNAPEKIPVYVGYFTAWPEASGRISYHSDIYERDAHLEKALEAVENIRLLGSGTLLVAPESGREKHENGKNLQAAEQHAG